MDEKPLEFRNRAIETEKLERDTQSPSTVFSYKNETSQIITNQMIETNDIGNEKEAEIKTKYQKKLYLKRYHSVRDQLVRDGKDTTHGSYYQHQHQQEIEDSSSPSELLSPRSSLLKQTIIRQQLPFMIPELMSSENITALDLHDKGIGDDKGCCLAGALSSCKNVTSINLAGNLVTITYSIYYTYVH